MEPERPIEKALRAYANKRREEAGAPLDLHPVTRKALQDEVRRKYATQAPESRTLLATLARFWPRFALAFGILAALGLAAALLLPVRDKSTEFVARNDRKEIQPASEAMPAPVPAAPSPVDTLAAPAESRGIEVGTVASEPAAAAAAKESPPTLVASARDNEGEPARALKRLPAAPITSPPVQLEEERTASTLALNAADTRATTEDAKVKSFGVGGRQSLPSPPAAQSGALALAPGQPALATGKAVTLDSLRKTAEPETDALLAGRASLARNAPSPDARPSSGGVAGVAFKTESVTQNLTLAQRFAEAPARRQAKDASEPKAGSVLADFRVEQAGGEEIRIIDNDGSVYTGYMRPSDTPATVAFVDKADSFSSREKKKLAAGALADASELKGISGQTYSFSVSGTNRTLKETIVFNGDLSVTNAVVSLSVTNVANEALGVNRQVIPLRLDNSRISGRARIGNRSEIEVNAVPTPR